MPKNRLNPLTDLPPPSVAVGHAAGKLSRGDRQNSTGVDQGVLDGSFADLRVVDQRVTLAEILEEASRMTSLRWARFHLPTCCMPRWKMMVPASRGMYAMKDA